MILVFGFELTSGSRLRYTPRPSHDSPFDIFRVDAGQPVWIFVTIWPGRKGQNRIEGLAANHKHIDACHELVVAVGVRRRPRAESRDRRSVAQ